MLFFQSPTGLYHPTMESSASSKLNHPYSPVNRINLDMDFEQNIFSQDYKYSQDYSMGYGSGHGSAHSLALANDDEEDNSPVKEVSPVKPKNPSRRPARAKKNDLKEPPKDWKVAKEIALCQAWWDVSKNNIPGNSMKTRGSGMRVRPKIGAFYTIIHNVEANHKSGTNDLDVYHKACAEYKMIYKQDFTLEHCYDILKDHHGWLDVEMPTFYKTQGRKKSKASETTLRLASGGINLNDEVDEVVEETQEIRPIGNDQSKAKKKSAGSSRGRSSSFVDLVADKFLNIKQTKGGKRSEEKQSYIELKHRELSIREAEVREAAQLEREKLETQRRTLELAERDKRDKDILFYNSEINSSLHAIQQQKLLEMKLEIKA
uniref:Uncharacterized protein n=1 Tax=Tanacetum cinerariifolium TaxID=118510 RepID=A0A6L2JM04_TANCI|nr:hypothetical protein [Tanacetum cinerariifolium]